MDRGAWQASVHRVAKSRTQLSMRAPCYKNIVMILHSKFYIVNLHFLLIYFLLKDNALQNLAVFCQTST